MNTLKYFRGIEQGDGRGDPYEKTFHWIQSKDIGSFKLSVSNGREFESLKEELIRPLTF
ncbi:hypothetical protein DM15PD_10740 [Aristophania vespae]|nr:hypothetical protein DM15PD_10740 [Aristophania vespae]